MPMNPGMVVIGVSIGLVQMLRRHHCREGNVGHHEHADDGPVEAALHAPTIMASGQ